jgi:hypothetical protein
VNPSIRLESLSKRTPKLEQTLGKAIGKRNKSVDSTTRPGTG